jgi:hypothetical protein
LIKPLILKPVFFFVLAVYIFSPKYVWSQNVFENALRSKMDSLARAPAKFKRAELFPNDAVQSVMTPTGFGGFGGYVFGGLGSTYPQVYSNKPDGIGSVGFCVGDPTKAVNFAAGVNVGKLLAFSDFSYNFIVSRKLWAGTSISAGALQAFASASVSDAPTATFYVAFSHALQWLPSKSPGSSALTYTIGAGNGRFWQKSPADIRAGKGAHGTGVFGNISYEVFKRVNLNAEWTGMNLGFSTGIRPFKKSALSFGMGVTNLTSYSASKPSLVASIGFPLSLSATRPAPITPKK